MSKFSFPAKIIVLLTANLFLQQASAGEGFFFLDSYPNEVSESLGLSDDVIQKAKMTTGALVNLAWREIRNPADTYKNQCLNPEIKPWHADLCRQLETQCFSMAPCKIAMESHCGGVVIPGNYFVTADHCVRSSNHWVKLIYRNKIQNFQVTQLELPQDLHYDLAIFKIHDLPADFTYSEIAEEGSLQNDQSVFGIGFPSMYYRENPNGDYPRSYNEMRITFGRITYANRDRESYCNFSNDIETAEPERWVLTKSCPVQGTHIAKNSLGEEFSAKVERNVLLTDTDMIHGMSGSPLFDQRGRVIGIGTTILKNDMPLDYSPSHQAVYVKGENILEVLRSLSK